MATDVYEEDDYMSEDVLNACVSDGDARPGLLLSHAERRKKAVLERKQLHDELNKQMHPSIKVMEWKNREEALSKPLHEDNKGFLMLQKMGYTPGNSIGKTGDGMVEPISVDVKTDRRGLGSNCKSKKKRNTNSKAYSAETEVSTETYRSALAEKFLVKKTTRDLLNSQRTCQSLDSRMGVKKPLYKWYWPPLSHSGDGSDSDSDLSDDRMQSRANTQKQSDSDEGINSDSDSSRHGSISEISSHRRPQKCRISEYIEDDDSDQHRDEEQDVPPAKEQLITLTAYLRKNYYYCIWCGVEYDNVQDLEEQCPGASNEAHDE